jgi:hypothetical protein
MELTILKHKISLYGNMKNGFIFRIYDRKMCIHFVIDLLKSQSDKKDIIWINKQRDWNGNFIFEKRNSKWI